MVEHRMVRWEVQLARDDREGRPQFDAMKLRAIFRVALFQVEAGQPAHEIIMPEGPPNFTVGHDLQANGFLHLYRFDDPGILDGGQFLAGDAALFEKGFSGSGNGSGSQQRADMVGAERRSRVGHRQKSVMRDYRVSFL